MKNKTQVITKINELQITNFLVKEKSVDIKSLSHNNIIQLSRWVDRSENLFMILTKGVIKIKFTKN